MLALISRIFSGAGQPYEELKCPYFGWKWEI